jgi:lysylphosphatidylglycerol synthetase-like protein (DUF2156 family)
MRRLPRAPVTVLVLALLATAGVVTASLGDGPSPRLLAAAGAGVGRPASALLVSALWCSGWVAYLAAAVLAVGVLPAAERRLGSTRTAVALVAGQVLGSGAGVLVVRALAALGDRWAAELAGAAVVGPFPGLLAVAALVSGRVGALWRRRVRVGLGTILVALLLYSGTTGDVLRLTGWCTGLAVAAVGRRPEWASVHPSRRESRALVALVLAVTALGPVVAAVSRTPDGPWAVLSHLFVSTRPPHDVLRAVCGPAGDPADCRALQARAQLTGRGPALLSVLPVLLQLVLAEGLRRGRRAAWAAASLFCAVMTVVGGAVVVAVLRTPAEALPMLATRPDSLPAVSVVAPFAVPAALLVLLWVTRRRFAVRAAPGAGRRWALAATGGLVAVGAAYVALGTALAGQFAQRPSPGVLLLDLLQRVLPPGWLGEVLPPLQPLHAGARELAGWAGVAVWTVLLVTALWVVRPAVPPGDAARARALVDRHGDGALSFMTTWAGNRYWSTPDGRAVVAHRVLGGVAVTTGDPVGEPDARAAAVGGFTAWCEEQGWIPCWYSVTSAVPEALAGRGFRRVQVAAETWLPLGSLAFTGRRWQDVRTAVNRARREGLEAQWTTWSAAPLALREQVVRLSEDWLAGKGLPEMGFTLGGLDELADDAVRCLLAVDAAGTVHGLTSWLPAHRDGVPVGWTLDVMRRARDAAPGVVDFLLATAATTFQDEGAEWVSLSGAPLALPPGAADRTPLTRLLELAGRTMEPVYGFRSLLAFKAKFQPRLRPLWLVYPDAADLPRIARAIGTAYLPDLSPGQAVRLAAALVRRGRHRGRPRPAPAPRRSEPAPEAVGPHA